MNPALAFGEFLDRCCWLFQNDGVWRRRLLEEAPAYDKRGSRRGPA
jgi:hypothetical protein